MPYFEERTTGPTFVCMRSWMDDCDDAIGRKLYVAALIFASGTWLEFLVIPSTCDPVARFTPALGLTGAKRAVDGAARSRRFVLIPQGSRLARHESLASRNRRRDPPHR